MEVRPFCVHRVLRINLKLPGGTSFDLALAAAMAEVISCFIALENFFLKIFLNYLNLLPIFFFQFILKFSVLLMLIFLKIK